MKKTTTFINKIKYFIFGFLSCSLLFSFTNLAFANSLIIDHWTTAVFPYKVYNLDTKKGQSFKINNSSTYELKKICILVSSNIVDVDVRVVTSFQIQKSTGWEQLSGQTISSHLKIEDNLHNLCVEYDDL